MATKYCPCCEAERKFRPEDRTEAYDVRGLEVKLPVKVEVCTFCGETLFDEARDQALLTEAFAKYRRRKNLLFPQEIKETRERYALSQKSFAALLGMSEATINRYEQGALQEESHDNAIRFAAVPDNMRSLLERRGHLLTDWQRKRANDAVESQVTKQERPTTWMMPTGVSDKTGDRAFDYDRYAAVVVWFCQSLGGVRRTKLNKLLFYADFLCYRQTGRSITGAAYRRLDHGPVPAAYGGLEDALEADNFIRSEAGSFGDGYDYIEIKPGSAASQIAIDFTPTELAVLKLVAKTFKGHGSKAISQRSHKEDAWTKTPEKSLISYQHATTLSLSLPG